MTLSVHPCKLDVSVSDPDRTYRPGDDVEGSVEMTATEEMTCRRLEIGLELFAESEDDREGVRTDTVAVIEDIELEAGQEFGESFTFQVPDSAISAYDGELIDIGWGVRAIAQVGWEPYPEAAAEFVVDTDVADSGEESHHVESGEQHDVDAAMVRPPDGRSPYIVGGEAAIVGIAFGAFGTGGAVVGAVMVGFVMLWLRSRERSLLKEATMEVGDATVAPGETVDVSVKLAPRKPRRIRRVDLEFRGAELTNSGRGSEHQLYWRGHRVPESLGLRVDAHETVEFEANFEVPEDAVSTVHFDNHAVFWDVEATIHTEGPSDWRATVPVRVR